MGPRRVRYGLPVRIASAISLFFSAALRRGTAFTVCLFRFAAGHIGATDFFGVAFAATTFAWTIVLPVSGKDQELASH